MIRPLHLTRVFRICQKIIKSRFEFRVRYIVEHLHCSLRNQVRTSKDTTRLRFKWLCVQRLDLASEVKFSFNEALFAFQIMFHLCDRFHQAFNVHIVRVQLLLAQRVEQEAQNLMSNVSFSFDFVKHLSKGSWPAAQPIFILGKGGGEHACSGLEVCTAFWTETFVLFLLTAEATNVYNMRIDLLTK